MTATIAWPNTATMSIEDAGRLSAMILEWDVRDDIYVVTVPDLPGCRTHGRTREEAVRQGQEAIECWIGAVRDAGEAIPAPRLFTDQYPDGD